MPTWRDTIEAQQNYRGTRELAQKLANETGFDYGVEGNDVFKLYRYFILPQRENRRGHELQCEVVSCETLENCRPGHGPHSRSL